jgi:hypothetical protein
MAAVVFTHKVLLGKFYYQLTIDIEQGYFIEIYSLFQLDDGTGFDHTGLNVSKMNFHQ